MGVATMKKTSEVDLLLEKYEKFMRLITKEQEELALKDDESSFTIEIELSKSMVKTFVRYYNLTCLYEYLDDAVMFTRGEEKEKYYKEYCKVCNTLERLKRNFYQLMANKFENHDVTLYDDDDEGVGESEWDLMTRWADDVQTQMLKSTK